MDQFKTGDVIVFNDVGLIGTLAKVSFFHGQVIFIVKKKIEFEQKGEFFFLRTKKLRTDVWKHTL